MFASRNQWAFHGIKYSILLAALDVIASGRYPNSALEYVIDLIIASFLPMLANP